MTEKTNKQGDVQFVRFYQRAGNVGIWGYADGCLQVRQSAATCRSCSADNIDQVHFPDHTKFVFSADGQNVSATLVSVEGANVMATGKELPASLFKDRRILSYSTEQFLQAANSDPSTSELASIVSANMFQDKVEFLIRIVSQWIDGGGLGCSREGEPKLEWEGLSVKDHAKKLAWTTVGRRGGDEMKA